MSITLLVTLFIVGYAAITLEHQINLNKTATALLTGVLCWTIYALFHASNTNHVVEELSRHLSSIAEILIFLLGAMTVVELIDAHEGFRIITDHVTSRNTLRLLWILSLLTFFLSALLDNLTTAIVMVSLLRKLVTEKEQRKFFAGIIIIAANAGGAWSPLGDVTTTMLWIGGQISAIPIMKGVFLPALVSLLIPLIYLSFKLKGNNIAPKVEDTGTQNIQGGRLMLYCGLGSLLFVPVFKAITQLPPYIGMLLGLGLVWVASEIIHKDKDEEERKPFTAVYALQRIDTSSILFFLGILLAISCLESAHVLQGLAIWMGNTIGNLDVIVVLIGLVSAVIDNVPLVAATMGMYDLANYPMDHKLWEFLAYAAGTGGSILIIGSAAGVAVMGMEKINFMWYLKRIGILAFIGYLGGAVTYLLIYQILH
ncbi:sodium:proton antiporter NhaD [Xanthocytophaga flava]|uniref:sodium:proton antiporter NhaD n=1 Tax=Xanthocytophaga flava TaxID=3048013 RepID=UPI0028D24306|nr:sodium:proton antiporter NhaD [Xanthocytophaga flavus]MDJ1467808.1 sodium:proton antiporter NhaD [Xanthocytophaga flavus]